MPKIKIYYVQQYVKNLNLKLKGKMFKITNVKADVAMCMLVKSKRTIIKLIRFCKNIKIYVKNLILKSFQQCIIYLYKKMKSNFHKDNKKISIRRKT